MVIRRRMVKTKLNRAVQSILPLQTPRRSAQLGTMSATAEVRPDSESPKRQLVLDAATSLFMAHGYGAVSMDAIARAAGVSKATLYAYFSSKDRLFATIIGEACRHNIAVTNFLPDGDADLQAGLTAFAGNMLRFLLEERAIAIHRVVTSESLRFPELGRAFYDNGPGVFRSVFGDWLAQQTAAGRLVVADPAAAADQFIGLLRGGLYLRATLGLTTPTEAEIDATVSSAVAAFLRAYAPG
jgi:TetR/AcrR family transcriptional regulator, mexJK operon transcriptional repressor